MKPEARSARPPRLAVWLVDLFAPSTQAEFILGDLHEEFSDLVARSGVAFARRWFWRHTLKTIAHLMGAAFRTAPLSLASAVLFGFALRWFAVTPDRIVVAILRTQTPYSNLHYDFYVWMVTWGIPIVRFIEFTLVGCIVAAAAKGREIIATTTLSIVSAVFVGLFFFLRTRNLLPSMPIPWFFFLENFENLIVIVLGGILVRKIRSVSAHRLLKP